MVSAVVHMLSFAANTRKVIEPVGSPPLRIAVA